MVKLMETLLRQTLLETATAFAAAENCAVSTVGRRCKNDGRFFNRLQDPKQSFTVRTYDEVMGWFSANWPDGTEKPRDLLLWEIEARSAV